MLGGCKIAGVAAARLLPPETIHPTYRGLAGQSVGVMVWTDRGVQIDFPNLALDLANSVEKKLRDQSGKKGKAELQGAIFPVQPASIVRYQHNHPNLDMQNLTEVAPRLGVTRLIYIEVEDFGTRAPAAIELFRGHMTATMQIVEVTGNAARIAHTENDIQAVYPPRVGPDGTPDGDDVRFYAGTIDAMSTQILNRLVSHQAEE